MSVNVIALLAFVVIFLLGSVRPVNMGAIALVGAFLVGTLVFGVSANEVLDGFPGDMFVILVGVTYLFAIAASNGTIEKVVEAAVKAVRGRIAFIPWAMFLIPACLTAVGAAAPAACAILIPIALKFAAKHSINPLLISMMVIQGTTAGGFSPIGIYGVIVNGISSGAGLPTNPAMLFAGTFATTLLVAAIAFVFLGGRELIQRRAEQDGGGGSSSSNVAVDIRTSSDRLTLEQTLNLLAIATLVTVTLVWGVNVGFAALTLAVVLSLVFPESAKTSVVQIAWPTVLLIGGIITYVGLLQSQGTIEWLGDLIAEVNAPLVAAFVILLIGAVVSAFASTTAILGVVIPLATPFLLTGEISVIPLIIALAVSSSVVDCSPLSTMGALAVANAEELERDRVFAGLMKWGLSLIVIAPALTFTLLILPSYV